LFLKLFGYLSLKNCLIKDSIFTEKLLKWSLENERDLPWKATKDAYTIWLSEIILQQTRVAQGRPYFNKFIAAYPTVTDLANAPEDEVMRLWEGLGYYSRARNLHFTAKHIAEELNGVFPNTYENIKLDLIRQHKNLPNPATFVIMSAFQFPLNETLLPIAKRSFVRFIKKYNHI